MINLLIFIVFASIVIYFSRRSNFLPNFSGETHQQYLKESKVPLIGGFFIIIISFVIFFKISNYFYYTIVSIFLIGLFSDGKILSSPKIRILLQLIIVFSFVYLLKLEVTPTRINFIDRLFENTLLSFLFTTFCLMILINGSNFVDGLNGLLIGYFLIILALLLKLNLINSIEINQSALIFFIGSIIFLLILNYSNFFYLGDSGAYSIGIIMGYLLITIYEKVNYISPYYVILLLWYPCFENLFSIIRKNKFKNSPINPDSKHLHQLLYFYLKKNFSLKNLFANNLGSIVINSFNFVVFIIASSNYSSTIFQLFLIIFCIASYLLFYRFLFNFRFIKKK